MDLVEEDVHGYLTNYCLLLIHSLCLRHETKTKETLSGILTFGCECLEKTFDKDHFYLTTTRLPLKVTFYS